VIQLGPWYGEKSEMLMSCTGPSPIRAMKLPRLRQFPARLVGEPHDDVELDVTGPARTAPIDRRLEPIELDDFS
jgi:hypothetical protein